MSAADVAAHIDGLYRQAVESPTLVDEPLLVDWAEAATEATGHDRQQARAVRRAIRTARKLAKYWSEHDPSGLPHWRNGVDEALGGRGWQAQLDLLRFALDQSPDPELFELVKQHHQAVHFTEWMEGVSYQEWLESR